MRNQMTHVPKCVGASEVIHSSYGQLSIDGKNLQEKNYWGVATTTPFGCRRVKMFELTHPMIS